MGSFQGQKSGSDEYHQLKQQEMGLDSNSPGDPKDAFYNQPQTQPQSDEVLTGGNAPDNQTNEEVLIV